MRSIEPGTSRDYSNENASPHLVCVFYPKQEAPSVRLRKEKVVERGSEPTNVEIASGRRGIADPDPSLAAA